MSRLNPLFIQKCLERTRPRKTKNMVGKKGGKRFHSTCFSILDQLEKHYGIKISIYEGELRFMLEILEPYRNIRCQCESLSPAGMCYSVKVIKPLFKLQKKK